MTAELEQYEKQHDPLPALRQQLAKEFEGIVPKDRIDEAAERAIGDFRGGPGPSFRPDPRLASSTRGPHGAARRARRDTHLDLIGPIVRPPKSA
jgi:hypothetical protein